MFILPFNLYADNIKISGKVIDSEDKPIEFATVKVAKSAIGTMTDIKGLYSLSLSERDTVELVFSCIGFKTVHHKLINPKGALTLNVRLYPADMVLEDVEVLGFDKPINGMRNLKTKSYRLSPDVSGGSVESMISTLPGVHSSNEMSSQYSVRGGTFDENSVYINGYDISRPQLYRAGEQEGLSIINPSMIEKISFSSGGFPARYSDKMSSVLDISYKSPESFEALIDLGLMGGALTIGQNTGIFSQLHGIRFKKNNSLLSTLNTKGEYDPTFFDYQTNLIFKISEKISFNFIGNIALNHYNFIPKDRETKFGTLDNSKKFKVYFDGEEKDRFETYFGGLSMIYKINRNTSASVGLSGFLGNEFVSYDISGEYWLDQSGESGENNNLTGIGKYMEHARDRLKSKSLMFFLRGNSKLRNNNLSYGLEYKRENFRDKTREWEWRDSAGYSLPVKPEGVNLIYNLVSNNSLTAGRISAYLEDALFIQTSKAFMTLNLGCRFSYLEYLQRFLFSPRINFSISPIDHSELSFHLSGGVYYQAPGYKELRMIDEDTNGNHIVTLNKNLKSPRSLQFIVGSDYLFRAFNRPFLLSGELYYKNLSDLISYEIDNLKVTYSGRNDSKGYVAGLDLKLFGQFVEGSDSWISFSLMKTEQTLDGKKAPLPNDQRYSLSLFFTDYFPKFPKLKFSLRGILSDGITLTPPQRRRTESYFRTPSYKRLDVGLSYLLVGVPSSGVRPYNFWRHFKRIEVGLECFNLLDINNVSNYFWITDVGTNQYAVPNYLTRRQFNIKLSVEI